MSHLFSREALTVLRQDKTRLSELDSHQLLEHNQESIASFDQVREIGAWFLTQHFTTVLPSSQPLPIDVLRRYQQANDGPVLTRIALGADASTHFPATAEVIKISSGFDIRLRIVPIPYAALETAAHQTYTDTLLALAAAAATAPHFLLALEKGLNTTECTSKKEVVTSITPDHGVPLAVTFESFGDNDTTLQLASRATNDRAVSVKKAAHLHGQSIVSASAITQAAGQSKVAAGVSLRTLMRSELPKHVLYVQTKKNEQGSIELVPMADSLLEFKLHTLDFSLVAAALGFTAQVVHDARREQMVEKVLTPAYAELPLSEVVRK